MSKILGNLSSTIAIQSMFHSYPHWVKIVSEPGSKLSKCLIEFIHGEILTVCGVENRSQLHYRKPSTYGVW